MSITSDFYLARAADCSHEAESTSLENVRERALRSQAAWLAMARRLRRGEELKVEAAADKAERISQDNE